MDVLDQYQVILGRKFSPLPSSACLTHLGMHTPSAVTTACWLFVLTQCVDALAAYEWLLCYLCVESHRKVQSEMAAKDVSSEGSIMRVAACVECVCVCVGSLQNAFMAREDSQVYFCHTLSLVFMEVGHYTSDPPSLSILIPPPSSSPHLSLSLNYSLPLFQYLTVKWFSEFVEDTPAEGGLQSVLRRLAGLYSVWCLHKHVAVLYQGEPVVCACAYNFCFL